MHNQVCTTKRAVCMTSYAVEIADGPQSNRLTASAKLSEVFQRPQKAGVALTQLSSMPATGTAQLVLCSSWQTAQHVSKRRAYQDTAASAL